MRLDFYSMDDRKHITETGNYLTFKNWNIKIKSVPDIIHIESINVTLQTSIIPLQMKSQLDVYWYITKEASKLIYQNPIQTFNLEFATVTGKTGLGIVQMIFQVPGIDKISTTEETMSVFPLPPFRTGTGHVNSNLS